jgi:hypothetical protein
MAVALFGFDHRFLRHQAQVNATHELAKPKYVR